MIAFTSLLDRDCEFTRTDCAGQGLDLPKRTEAPRFILQAL